MPLFDTSPASREAMVVKEPVGSPSRQQKEGSSSFNSTAWECGHSCVPPRRKGWGCGILCTGRVCQPRSAIRLARAFVMASALAHRRVSPSSRNSLAQASLVASVLARRRVSPSSRDSLARASLMVLPSLSLFWRFPRKSS